MSQTLMIQQMTISQNLTLLQDVWNDLARTPENVPLPKWQEDELAKLLAEHKANPEAGEP